MIAQESMPFSIVDREFFETVDRYHPNEADFISTVRRLLPDGWETYRGGVWFHCFQLNRDARAQGWKIHVSATPGNACDVLNAVVPLLIQDHTPFKFLVDRRIVLLINSKAWPRGGSGKFMTIYPTDDRHFQVLLETLHGATAHFDGPYVLSDRRYRDSRVLYYRYGGIQRIEQVDVSGTRTLSIVSPEGKLIPDRRNPFFSPPDWASDPISEQDSTTAELTLKDGRYVIERAFVFKNSGGVYLAHDNQVDRKVVIKEGRPLVGWTPTGADTVALLKKEFRLLRTLEGTNIAPKPLDLFQDWEHWFLVEEYVRGLTIANHSVIHNPILWPVAAVSDLEHFLKSFRNIFAKVARAFEVLHGSRIVFGDLSFTNVLLTEDLEDVKLIDFEGAYEPGVDAAPHLVTPGFEAPEYLRDGVAPQYQGDYYALGAIMLAYLFPINFMLGIKPSARHEFLEAVCRDLRIPFAIRTMITNLLNENPGHRPSPREIRSLLETTTILGEPSSAAAEEPLEDFARRCIKDIVSFALSKADTSREDRLFPADPRVFQTNALSIGYGASGIAYAIKHVSGVVPDHIAKWILRQPRTPEHLPPGLYVGLSGLAWALLELGFIDEAEATLRTSYNHKLLYDSPDLFDGLAGWGMTNLKFFLQTGEEAYLVKATEAGQRIAESRKDEGQQSYWAPSGQIPLGLAHGASGIALFLLYLHLATGDETFLTLGERALSFDITQSVSGRDGELCWKDYKDSASPVVYPYWRFGSAGVGMSVLRYKLVRPRPIYDSILDGIVLATDKKYAVFPGYFIGLSGLGHFLLDMHYYDGKSTYLEKARRIGSGIRLFAVNRKEGVGFPGHGLLRLSCDYGTGSAGVALFLNRFVKSEPTPFLLDELLVDLRHTLLTARDRNATSASVMRRSPKR